MKSPRPPLRGSAAVVVVGLTLLSGGLFGLIATGCSEQENESVNQVHRYTVHARIINLPSADKPGSEFTVHHEHIPDLRGPDGEIIEKNGVRGMAPMIMPFPLGPGVDLEGLKIEDMVEIEFVVNWSRKPPYYVTHIELLEEGTLLNTNLITPEDVAGDDATDNASGEDAPDGDG